jgi:hypothetical protein
MLFYVLENFGYLTNFCLMWGFLMELKCKVRQSHCEGGEEKDRVVICSILIIRRYGTNG